MGEKHTPCNCESCELRNVVFAFLDEKAIRELCDNKEKRFLILRETGSSKLTNHQAAQWASLSLQRRGTRRIPLEEIAAVASKKAIELLDHVMIKTQKAAVVFDPDVARALLGGVISAVNGERVLQGASFLKDYLNKQFASSLLTITDDGTRHKSPGSAPFDGEGVPTVKNVLVENGVLKSFIYNTKAAKRAGVKSTGNASRGGFSSLPGIGTHNVYVSTGKHTRNEIIAATKKGLLLLEVTGYGIDPVSGNFSGGASGLWIENGEFVHPVKGVTIAGRAFDILNAIDMMGNDLDLNRTNTAPTFRVAEMQIGGK